MVRDTRWLVYLLAMVGGACLVFLLLVVPRLVWAFFRKQWYRVALRHNTEQEQVLATQAYRRLTESDRGTLAPGEQANDLAVIACLRRDFAEAAELLERLQPAESGGPEAANLLVALAATQQWERMTRLFDQLPTTRDCLPEANLARIAFAAPPGDLLARVRALAEECRFPSVLNNLAVRHLRAGDLDAAEEDLALALRQRSGYAPGRANAGVVAFRRGQMERALTETASAAVLAAGEAVICSNLGALLCQAGDLINAERWLLRAEALAPRSLAVAVHLGNAYAVEGKYEDALEAYERAGRLGECAAASHNVALLHLARAELDLAWEAQVRARELAPGDPDILNNLGCIHWARGEYVEAEECFAQAAEIAPDSAALGNLISADLAAGRAKEALERLAAAPSEDVTLHYQRGLGYLLTALQIDPAAGATQRKLYQYHLEAANAEFRKVTEAGEGPVAEAYLNQGATEYLQGNYEEAAEAFAQAARLQGEGTDLVYPVASCYLMAARETQEQRAASPDEPLVPAARELLRRARPYLEKALEVRSTAGAAGYDMGVLHYLLGEYDKAVALLRRVAVADAPPHVFNALAVAEARAAQALQRQVAASTTLGDQRKRQLTAQVNARLSSAIHHFREVLRAQPHSPIVHANTGLAFMLRNQPGDIEAALHHWQLMRQVGGEWGQRAFELFSRAMSGEEARRLRFHDIEITFQPLPVAEWITLLPPRPAGLKYLLEDLPDLRDWTLQAYHPLIKRALRCRARAERLRAVLQQLAV